MPTARYWRLAQCESYYLTGLELSELALYSAGTRIDGLAILSCPTPLSSGTLENLRDSSFESTARWDETHPLPPGFALVWDFGSDVSVDEVGVAGPSQSTFLHKFSLQYSSDGIVWSESLVISTKFIGSDAFFNYMAFSGEGDPHFSNVSLLLHMDGANGSTTFTDSSSRPKQVTVASGNPQINTAQSKFGGSSAYFPGSARLLVGASADFGFGSGDYTFEAWVRLTDRNEFQCLFDNRVGGAQGIGVFVGNGSGTACVTNNTVILFYSTNVVPLGEFFHIAVVRNSEVVTIYLNGVSNGSAPDTRTLSSEASCYIGESSNTGSSLAGYLDEVRVTKGVARYTENFTPPTMPFPNSSSGVIPDLTPLRQNRRSDAVSISEYPVSPTTLVVSTDKAPHIDVQDGGSGRIAGTVKEKATPSNTPLRRKVWLLNYNDGRIVRETWSDELTGAYEFTDIDMNRTYTVVSLDHTGQYRAVIADNLSPEKM